MDTRKTITEILQHILRQHPELLPNLVPSLPRAEQTSIKYRGDFDGPIGKCLHESFQKALCLDHSLPDWIVWMSGMSGKKYRYFINNLIRGTIDARYLEVGCWSGSTAVSAMFNNTLQALCIDNWSEFNGPKELFLKNIENAKGENCRFDFIESDFRKVDFKALGFDANIYLYDGPHTEQDQYDGIVYALPALHAEFVLIVDDYNWAEVRKGTERAISDCGLTVRSSIEVRTTTNDTHPNLQMQNSDWHNGYFIAHIRKALGR